jgi:hypothetical protein
VTNRILRTWTGRAVAFLTAATVVAGTSSLALAAAPTKLTQRGSCSGPTSWRLTLSRSGASLNVTFAASGGVKGQMWNVFGDHNDLFMFAVSRKAGTDGAFTVKAGTVNFVGVDRVHVEAQNRKTGEICSASASL